MNVLNPLVHPEGWEQSQWSPASPLKVLRMNVSQRLVGVRVHQGWCECRGCWGGPEGRWQCSLAAASHPPELKLAPSAGSRTEPESPPDSPGWRYEHATPWKKSEGWYEQRQSIIELLFLLTCVFVPAALLAGRGSVAGGSDWFAPAGLLAGVGWGLGARPAARPAGRGTPPHRPAAAWKRPSHKPNAAESGYSVQQTNVSVNHKQPLDKQHSSVNYILKWRVWPHLTGLFYSLKTNNIRGEKHMYTKNLQHTAAINWTKKRMSHRILHINTMKCE